MTPPFEASRRALDPTTGSWTDPSTSVWFSSLQPIYPPRIQGSPQGFAEVVLRPETTGHQTGDWTVGMEDVVGHVCDTFMNDMIS